MPSCERLLRAVGADWRRGNRRRRGWPPAGHAGMTQGRFRGLRSGKVGPKMPFEFPNPLSNGSSLILTGRSRISRPLLVMR
jgi:hypothetical protein